MAERINQHKNPIIGSNIRRLRLERNMKATEVIAKLQLKDVNVMTEEDKFILRENNKMLK